MIDRRALLTRLTAVAVCLTTPAFAQQAATDNLEISGGFARATPELAKVGAAYLTITSLGTADRLVGFTTPACNRPELHTHIDEDGVMRMRQVDAIDVPAGGVAELKPGGLHMMLIDLNGHLVEGETLDLTLVFEEAGEVAVTVPIKALGAMGAGNGCQGHGMGQGHAHAHAHGMGQGQGMRHGQGSGKGMRHGQGEGMRHGQGQGMRHGAGKGHGHGRGAGHGHGDCPVMGTGRG